ncbi:MmgE/PrpD family protein [Rhizobium sp. P32RR-XVIII]|uniref:MmgE/PrpD family protein n=1 Tax=Rhizobium sp. P32RR-XVIII TaxID=2726738 RepID=UPI0014563D25|nr:MmgE/PrpD family protein [Rhizobium sp. P32RR-XVIII]NLS06085.1 MmgE/PrpD family protein [Rhizobium sp. P32RR-XVIII]
MEAKVPSDEEKGRLDQARNPHAPSISQRLAYFAKGLDFQSIPAEAVSAAKLLILDAVGIAYASSTYGFAATTLSALTQFGSGQSAVIGFRERLSLRDAATMNGVLSHGLDYDDTHLMGVIHATSSCFPTALAVAADLDRSGKELLTAYVIAMETSARIGMVAKGELNQVGFHPTGVVAAFGTAIAASWLHRLDVERLIMAQGIVLSMASGTREYSLEGAGTKRLHPGWAAVCGITAAKLAAVGVTGPTLAYEGQFGLFNTHLGVNGAAIDLPAATSGLGETWEVTRVAIKPFPACQLSIACIDAAIAINHAHHFRPEDIVRIETAIPPHAVKIVCEPLEQRRHPHSSYAAQFSLPFVVACGLIHGRLGLPELELYADPTIVALAEKVEYRVDHDTAYPRYFSGEVRVTLRDGQVFEWREDINRGAAERPVGSDEIIRKFMDNATLRLSRREAERIRDLVLALDDQPSARIFADALAAPANRKS